MFWNDIADIKKEMQALKDCLLRMERALVDMIVTQKYDKDLIESFAERLIEIQQCTINRKVMDMFQDYMKNVDKLNAMVNEFKGCVTLARGALEDRKKLSEKEADLMNAISCHVAQVFEKRIDSKIDYICENIGIIAEIVQKKKKKSPKKRKSVKKKQPADSVVSASV